MNEWIGAKELLPEESYWGILVWDGNRVTLGCTVVTENSKELWSQTGTGNPATITHWMPFPKPPESS